jgi:hypothetical protein
MAHATARSLFEADLEVLAVETLVFMTPSSGGHRLRRTNAHFQRPFSVEETGVVHWTLVPCPDGCNIRAPRRSIRFRDEIARTKDAASGRWKLALDPGGEREE